MIVLTTVTLPNSGRVLDLLGTFECVGIESYEVFDNEHTGPLNIESVILAEKMDGIEFCIQCERAIAERILLETGVEILVR